MRCRSELKAEEEFWKSKEYKVDLRDDIQFQDGLSGIVKREAPTGIAILVDGVAAVADSSPPTPQTVTSSATGPSSVPSTPMANISSPSNAVARTSPLDVKTELKASSVLRERRRSSIAGASVVPAVNLPAPMKELEA